MNEISLQNIFDLLGYKCDCINTLYDKNVKGTISKDELGKILQNITAMGGREPAIEFLELNPKLTDKDKEKFVSYIVKWIEEKYKCYSCEKLGCSMEQIKECHGTLIENNEGVISNSQWNLCNPNKLKLFQEIEMVKERIEDYADKIFDGKKALLSDEDVVADFALIAKYNPDIFNDFLEELQDNKLPYAQFEKRVLKKSKELGRDKSPNSKFEKLTEENATEGLKIFARDMIDVPEAYINNKGHIVSTYGDVDREVCNFIPVITAKYIISDGVDTECSYDIHLLINGEKETQNQRIIATDLKVNTWISKYYAADAVLYTNFNYDAIYNVAMSLAENIPATQISYKLGWKKGTDGLFGYGYSGSCLGNDTIACAEIKELFNYEQVKKEISLRDSFEVFNRFLNKYTPDKKGSTIMLLAYTFNSPLFTKMNELGIPNKSVLWVHGTTGSFKSETAKLLLSFWGNVRTLPCSFQDTIASIERKMNLASDALLVVDDFCPSSSKSEEMRKIQTAQRMTRNIGDRISRGRAKSNMSLAPSYKPECNVLTTGEDVIGGTSTLSRHLSVQMCKGDVDVDTLTYLQAHTDELAVFMKYYLLWLKDNIYDNDNYDLYDNFVTLRNEAGNESQHRRFAEAVAQLNLSIGLLVDFMIENDLVTENAGDALMEEANKSFLEFAEEQNRAAMADDPADIFMSAIHELITTGQIIPVNPKAPSLSTMNSNPVFFDGKDYWIIPSSTYSKVSAFCFEKGTNFPISERALWNVLSEKGYLILNNNSDGHAKFKHRCKIGSSEMRVIKINKEILDSF